jgi:pyrroline-5-carboxylate reductase
MIQALTPPFIKLASSSGADFYINTPSGSSAKSFADKYDINFLKEVDTNMSYDYVWLGMKPQQIQAVSEELWESDFSNSIIISLLAGVETKRLKSLFKGARVIRIMPNTPSKIGHGVNGIFFDPDLDVTTRDNFMSNFSDSGRSFVLDKEEDVDLITPYSGSGPAYFFEIVRILSEDLSRRGLNKEDSLEIVALTMKGAAQMILESEEGPETLRNNVTSKGGVTFEALKVLEENKLSSIIEDAIDAALKRNNELKEV